MFFVRCLYINFSQVIQQQAVLIVTCGGTLSTYHLSLGITFIWIIELTNSYFGHIIIQLPPMKTL